MGQYLTKFQSTVSQSQIQQIINTLNSKRNVGQIRTIQEFNDQLASLIKEITSTVFTPQLKVFPATGGTDTSAEQYNTMLTNASADLSTCFTEANNIDTVQKDHEAIIQQVVFANIRAAIAELQTKVAVYQFIGNTSHGLNTSISSHFNGATNSRTLRTSGGQSSNQQNNLYLFVDPKNSTVDQGFGAGVLPPQQDADVTLVGNQLMLGASTQSYIQCEASQVFLTGQPQSTNLVSDSTNYPLSNITNKVNSDGTLDQTNSTYWVESFLFSTPQTSMTIELDFNFQGIQTVNFIEISPVTKKGIYLQDIYYIDGNTNNYHLLGHPNILLTGPVGINIPPTTTRTMILTFVDTNCQLITYDPKQPDSLFQLNSPSITGNVTTQPINNVTVAAATALVNNGGIPQTVLNSQALINSTGIFVGE